MPTDRNVIILDFNEVPIVCTGQGLKLPDEDGIGMKHGNPCGHADFRAEIGLPLYLDNSNDWMITEVWALTFWEEEGITVAEEVKQPFANKLGAWLERNRADYIQDKVDEIDLPRRVA